MLTKLKPKSEFSKNVLTLMTGTTIAQAIPIAISPILTRIYTPEDFGVFALYLSLVSILAVVVTGKYELAIMLPKKDNDAFHITVLSFILTLSISFLIFLIILFYHDFFLSLFENKNISIWLYFIPLSTFLIGTYNSLNYWVNRKKYYKDIAVNKIVQTSSTGVTNIAIGYWNILSMGGMIFGQIIGQVIGLVSFLKKFIIDVKYYRLSHLKLIAFVKKYKSFPFNSIPSSLVNAVYNNGKFLILGIVFTSGIVGQLYLAFRVLMMPVSIISNSIANILFQKTSVWKYTKTNKLQMWKSLKKVLFVLMTIATFPSIIIYLYSESLFVFIFGDEWNLAGSFASLLSIALFFQFSITPFCKVFYTMEKQKLYLIWEVMRSILVFLPVVALGYMKIENNIIIFTMSISISVSYLVLLIFLRGILK
ncbi:lipopolysaccharide biosynthesis protein [Halarcobacter sp.]|uniref:lipopolysaccharide biosynthesis protein n=1 Tax=Halarcobacter sp. TaxID=2321133 RepID=UPI003A8E399B